MMEWELIKISDIGKVVTGNTPPRKKPEYYGDHTIFIKPTDISEDEKYTYNPDECYSELGFRKYRNSLIPAGSTCVVTIGSIGKKITKAHCDCFINQAMNAVIPNVNFDQEFVFYVLKYNLGQLKMLDSGTASGRENVSKSSFANIKINIPKEKDVQYRIGKILASYDDLIENNLKRIKLLEEIAQRTYEEWFVKFRVNGEQLAIDEATGLPVGWERKKLSEIADIKWGDTSVTKSSYCKKGFLAYSASGPDGLLDYFDYDKSGVVLSAIGAYAGLTWLALGKWSAIKNTMVFWSKQKALSDHYLFLATRGRNYWNRRGAAQPFIAQGDAKLQQIVLPNEDINIQFTKIVEPIYEVIYKLNATNKLLRESRDILLPRLMNGTINVES